MELEFTQEQDELRDSMRAVLAKECPVALARKVVEHDIRPDALWSTLTALVPGAVDTGAGDIMAGARRTLVTPPDPVNETPS